MMWMPLYLFTNQQSLSNYDVSWFVAFFEVGTALGGFVIGAVSDFMRGRRYPLLVLNILVGAVFTY
jgi:sugar phosphate permease